MLDTLALVVVLLFAFHMVALAVVAFANPALASKYLLGFAASAFAHYIELLLRILIGGAFLLRAPGMLFPGFFELFGWIFLITTAGLLLVPWQWHRAFARRAVPYAVRSLGLVAVSSLLAGGFVFYAVLH